MKIKTIFTKRQNYFYLHMLRRKYVGYVWTLEQLESPSFDGN